MAGIKWTEPEIKILKKWYQNGGRTKVREELNKKGFNRSKNSITIRARFLGIKGDFKGKYQLGCNVKTCPICKEEKNLSEFGSYFSKTRQVRRVQNYCLECEPLIKRKYAKEYFLKNREKVLQYARDYRANPKNKEKLKQRSQKFKKLYREILQDCYLVEQASNFFKITVSEMRNHPDLIEVYKNQLLLKRKVKQLCQEIH